MASSSLGTLTLDLIARTGGFVKGMTKAERSSKKWRKQVERDLKKLRGQFATFAKLAAGAGAAAAGAFTILAKEGLQFVDAQAKMATRLGTTIDDLRAVQIAASDYGIEQGRLTSSLASFTKRLGDAARGTGEAQKAYKALGLEAKDLVNLPLPEQLALIAERIAQVDSAAERTSIADRLMSGGRGMVNLFEEGGGAIRDAVDEVEAFGLKLSEIDSKAVEDANDAIGRIPRALEPIRNQIAINLAEPLEDVADLFNEAAKDSGNFSQAVIDGMESAARGVAFLIDKLESLRKLYLTIREADLILQVGLETAQNAVTPGEQETPAADALAGVRESLDKIERGDNAEAAVREFFEGLGQGGIQENADRRARLQEGFDAGLGMDSGISNDAIDAANAVAESMRRVKDAANDSADADEDATDKSKDATDAVKGLGDSSDRAASALAAIGSGDWGKGAMGTMQGEQDNGATSVRQAIEAGKDMSAYWLEPNPTAKPTWSTDYLTNPESDLADRVSASSSWSSVNSQSMAKVQSSAESMTSHAASAKDRGKVTIKVVGDNGNTEGALEGEDGFVRQLANALSGVAAGSR